MTSRPLSYFEKERTVYFLGLFSGLVLIVTSFAEFPFFAQVYKNYAVAVYFSLLMVEIFYCLAIFFLSWQAYTLKIMSVFIIGLSFLTAGWFKLLHFFFQLETPLLLVFPQTVEIAFFDFFPLCLLSLGQFLYGF